MRHKWTPKRIAFARRLRASGLSLREIAAAMATTSGVVSALFQRQERLAAGKAVRGQRRPTVREPVEPEAEAIEQRPQRAGADLLAHREQLAAARARRDLTAEFFGDPPPGYSALDRKRDAGWA